MKFQILLLLILSALTSCSNLSKNFVKKGELGFKGGTYHDEKWSETLTFSRTSWYHDMNLYFESLVVRPVEKSPFTRWFSDSERVLISDCSDFFVAITYSLDSDRISQTDFRQELERNGYRTVSIGNFKRNIMLHPDAQNISLDLYTVQGYCKLKGVPQSTIVVRFPGFLESTIF